MKKLNNKSQELKLPLIEQSIKPFASKVSKDSTKRSNKSSKNSYDVRSREKQKNFPKLSNFLQIKQNKSLLENRSLDQKQLSRSTGKNSLQQTLSDFAEKIKQNKILLKKFQMQKMLEKQPNTINEKANRKTLHQKQPLIQKDINTHSEIDNIAQIRSKKLLSHLNNKINNQFRQSQETNKFELRTITQSPNISDEILLKRKHHLNRLNKKMKSQDIFQKIQVLLSGLQSNSLVQNAFKEKKNILNRMAKYKEKLKKIQPNSDYIQSLNNTLERNKSLPFLSPNNNNTEHPQKTLLKSKLPWERVIINKKEISKLSSSFDEQIEKVDFYQNKSAISLEQLLKSKIEVLDLKLIEKMKQKKFKTKI